jgi:iron complex outermembrane receptor protein
MLLGALFYSAAGWAQSDSCTLKIAVQALEVHNRAALFPALLRIPEIPLQVQSDPDGNFVLPLLCAGSYTFALSASGNEPVTQTYTLTADTALTFLLPHIAGTLGEVVVQDRRVRGLLQSEETLNAAALQASAGKSIADLLATVNGVTTFSNGATVAKPVIHGLSGNRILTIHDGVRQEDQQWGSEHALNIDPFSANRITVVKGAAGVRWGTDALGGVILVESAPLRRATGWGGSAEIALFSNNRMGTGSLQLEHRFKAHPAWAFRVQGSAKRGGNYQLPSGRWAANTGISEGSFSGILGRQGAHSNTEISYSRFQTGLGIYTGSHTGTKADLEAAIKSRDPLVPARFTYALERPRQNVVHQVARLHHFADTRMGGLTLLYAWQQNHRQEYDIVRIDRGNAQLNLTLQTQTLSANLDLKPRKNWTHQVGIDGTWQRNRFADGDRLFIPFYDALAGGAYALSRYKKGDWTAEAGARYDLRHYQMLTNQGNGQTVVPYNFQYGSFSGTAALRRQLAPGLEGSVTLARSWRPPNAAELFAAGLHQGTARIELGNSQLQPEAATSITLGADWQRERFALHLSGYRQWINNFIFLQPGADILTIRGYYKTFGYRQTNATLTGLDASASWEATKHLQLSARGSLLAARDQSADDWIILMPSNRGTGTARWSGDLGKFKTAFVQAEMQYVARQNRIPQNFDVLDDLRPPADYTLLGISVGATLPTSGITVSLAAENLLNRRYREYLDAFRYFLDRPGRNFILRVHVPFKNNPKAS